MDYKKYSLENLENWLYDAMSAGEATPQEIYDVIVNVVKDNYYTYKHQASQAYELLSKLNGHPTEYNWLDNKKTTSQDCGFEAVSGKDYVDNYYKNVMPSATQREVNKYCKAYDLTNQVCLDDEIERIKQEGGYDWTPLSSEDKVIKWQLPVQQSGEDYYVNFPDDLLEAANLKEGDQVEWVDQGNGSYLLRKV